MYRRPAEELPDLPGFRHAPRPARHLVTSFIKESGMIFHDGRRQPVAP
ncbi:hypothetical protein [Streptomyces sp. NPDC056937]